MRKRGSPLASLFTPRNLLPPCDLVVSSPLGSDFHSFPLAEAARNPRARQNPRPPPDPRATLLDPEPRLAARRAGDGSRAALRRSWVSPLLAGRDLGSGGGAGGGSAVTRERRGMGRGPWAPVIFAAALVLLAAGAIKGDPEPDELERA
jgi:hypothetical protein